MQKGMVSPPLFIAKVRIGCSKDGSPYFSYKLLKTSRSKETGRFQQRIILNLGSRYTFTQKYWKPLCDRIEEILSGLNSLILPE
jgi:hypothetical protein